MSFFRIIFFIFNKLFCPITQNKPGRYKVPFVAMRDASHYITETNYVFCSLQRRKGTNKGTGKGTGIRVRLVVMEEGIDPLQPRVIKTGAIMLLSQNMPITTNTPQSLRRHHRHRDMFRIIIVVVPPPNHYQRSIQILCAI